MNWYFLPGLGMDHREFEAYRNLLPNTQVISWATHHHSVTLETLAQHLAQTIGPDQRHGLIGSSLGGVVASMIARHTNPAMVALIASTTDPQALTESRQVFQWLSNVSRASLNSWLGGLELRQPKWLENLDGEALHRFREMVSDYDITAIHRVAELAMAWTTPVAYSGPLLHVHGETDTIIPIAKVSPSQRAAGGHLLSLTHAADVRDFLVDAQEQAESHQ